MNDWPSLNALVWLRLPCCNAEHPTRVEDYPEDGITVAAPEAPHSEPVKPLGPNEGFFIGWTMGRGALEVPVSLVQHSEGAVPTWTLRAIGEPVETQRRNFVRVDVELDIRLRLLTGGAPSKGTTVDLSEGGLRCLVDKWAPDPGNRIFTVQLTLGDDDYELDAQAAWWGNLDVAERRTVGIRFFEISPNEADRIRAYVFAAQLEQRRRRVE